MDVSFDDGAWTMIGPPILDLWTCVEVRGRATISLDLDTEGAETSGLVFLKMDLPSVIDRFKVSGVLEEGELFKTLVRPNEG
jgi:hypothetical protein